MQLREWFIAGSFVLVIGTVSVFSLINANEVHEKAFKMNSPYLMEQYKVETPVQQEIADRVVQCLVQYAKVDPGHTDVASFDPNPLSGMDEVRRKRAVDSIRERLEPMCIGSSAMAMTRPGFKGTKMKGEEYLAEISKMGMNAEAGRQELLKMLGQKPDQ